jgi:hypothetical protein
MIKFSLVQRNVSPAGGWFKHEELNRLKLVNPKNFEIRTIQPVRVKTHGYVKPHNWNFVNIKPATATKTSNTAESFSPYTTPIYFCFRTSSFSDLIIDLKRR